ncbi:MAG: glutamine-hydrolyzing GMP synthase, partial [Candidatus Pacebacteria bacterium]|nr:glutamine-hydrolyzing GMP synthase [Candidatus Paceibacterota bacterium]
MDKIIVLDFGSQYCHLISRRIREAGVLAEVVPADISAKKLAKDSNIKGIILSGGAQSVFDKKAIKFDKNIFDLKIPILGICYGHQLIAHTLGGEVIEGEAGEYGLTKLDILKPAEVLSKLGKTKKVWMNHRDKVVSLPRGFKVYAETKNSKVAVYGNSSNDIYGVQFHPEVSHTEGGDKIFKNFVFEVCKCEKTRSSKSLVQDIIQEMKDTIGENKAIIGLSGGVDSSVAAMIGSIAIGKQMVAVYVDTGLMRYKETKRLQETFKDSGLDLRVIKAGSKFFKALKGVISPERKRKIIGKLFVDIFSVEAKKEKADFLVQGTIYSDRIESGITKHSSKIKSHHNVGG